MRPHATTRRTHTHPANGPAWDQLLGTSWAQLAMRNQRAGTSSQNGSNSRGTSRFAHIFDTLDLPLSVVTRLVAARKEGARVHNTL